MPDPETRSDAEREAGHPELPPADNALEEAQKQASEEREDKPGYQ